MYLGIVGDMGQFEPTEKALNEIKDSIREMFAIDK